MHASTVARIETSVDVEEFLEKKELYDKALNEIFEGSLDVESTYFESKETVLDYAKASADIFTQAVTVVSISTVLAGELISEKLKDKKPKKK